MDDCGGNEFNQYGGKSLSERRQWVTHLNDPIIWMTARTRRPEAVIR